MSGVRQDDWFYADEPYPHEPDTGSVRVMSAV